MIPDTSEKMPKATRLAGDTLQAPRGGPLFTVIFRLPAAATEAGHEDWFPLREGLTEQMFDSWEALLLLPGRPDAGAKHDGKFCLQIAPGKAAAINRPLKWQAASLLFS
jgi:hypothetical protein